MSFRVISEARKLAGKIAVVRLDTNVPLKGKKVEDDARLRAALPTLRYLERHGARLVLMGHLGRPQGKKVAALSLKPIGYTLGKLLRQKVLVLPLSKGPEAIKRAAERSVVLVENIRFERGEDTNDPALAKTLGKLGNLFVNEAFSVSHRTAASVVGIARHLPSYAGLALAAEVTALEHVRKAGKKPVVVVIGGAKVADKLPVIAKLLPRASAVLVGGAVANTFLRAKKYRLGASLVDEDEVAAARALLKRGGKKLVLPIDVVVDNVRTRRGEAQWKLPDEVGARERVVDVGTRTTLLYASFLKKANTVFWAGPLGLVEEHQWSHGTLSLARLVSARARGPAFVLVGGGDTVNLFHQHKLWVDHASLAGSALLDFLAGVKLPGLTALEH